MAFVPITKPIEVIDPARARWDHKSLPVGAIVELPPMVAEWWVQHGLGRVPGTDAAPKLEQKPKPVTSAGESNGNAHPAHNRTGAGTRRPGRPKAAHKAGDSK